MISSLSVADAASVLPAAGPVPVFTAVTVGEAGEALVSASAQLLSPTSTELEADLFFQRLLGPAPAERPSEDASQLAGYVRGWIKGKGWYH